MAILRHFTACLTCFALVASLTFASCRHRPKVDSDPRVENIWLQHKMVFKKALDGRQVDNKFEEACVFFERLTGRPVQANFSTVGVLPTRDTNDYYIFIDNWYKKNHQLLYWDESLREVMIRAPALSKSGKVDPKAQEIWRHHDQVFKEALSGSFKGEELESAWMFFERVTGLSVKVEISIEGVRPTPETKADYDRLQVWYGKNMDRLYWDEATGTVNVRPVSSIHNFGRNKP